MQRERVTESVYVFTSALYAQVTATLITTAEGAVLVDTLLYPEETLQISRFVHERLNMPVRYVVNTHYHADHTLGTCFFPDALVIAHRQCRDLLDTRGRKSLEVMRANANDLDNVQVVLPQVVFDDQLMLCLGNKTLRFWHVGGHSPDAIIGLMEEEQVLLGADTVMALPHFVDGHYETFVQSLQQLQGQSYECIVQGHGEVILRGEIEDRLAEDLAYLNKLQVLVDKAIDNAGDSEVRLEKALEAIKIETCGKSKVLLSGAVQQLHRQNVLALAKARRAAHGAPIK